MEAIGIPYETDRKQRLSSFTGVRFYVRVKPCKRKGG